jgi:exopolysaccharide production repressor protein
MIKRYTDLLRAPRVFIQMIIMAFVTAIVTYFYTYSLPTSALYGLACFILQQAGYFGGVLFMVWRDGHHK